MRRIVPLLLVALVLTGAGIVNAQENDDEGGSPVSPRGRQNAWSYAIFFVFTLLTVYFVFRGNKRA